MLRRFKRLKLDQHNIVEFIDCFQTKHGKAIVLEMLDVSLGDYLEMTSFAPMLLSDISSIIQQVQTPSAPSDRKQSTEHSVTFRLWYILTDLVLTDGDSI